MLTGLTQPVEAGQHITGTLTFEHAGKIEVEYTVQPVGGPAPAAGSGPGIGDGHEMHSMH